MARNSKALVPAATEQADAATHTSAPDHFDGYVVALGASAGGLDALERFFDELPANTGAAIVVIQHLSPDHKSMMDNLLARHTQMPVSMAENGISIQANHVYLIPPGKNMTIAGSELCLVPKTPHGLSLPIDLFLSSLAKVRRNRCVAVILSGTGSDGTRGGVAINDAGGFLLAQTPESAKFDGMPRSIIATGFVDEVLPPELLASRVASHINNTHPLKVKVVTDDDEDSTENPMEGIFHLLYQIGGINFKDYKPTTVMRRIERRMQVRHVRELSDYLTLLENDRTELHTLKRDTLITVTNFFRDQESFKVLQEEVMDRLVKEHSDGQPIRFWVAGCSTGEEPYSLAMLFADACERHKRWPQLKIFATDVEQQYIDFASAGVYAEGIVNEITPHRLERFFTRNGNQFVIKSDIRQHIVFARHNVLEDPPFTRMDLVSCRNTLIYFESQAQDKVLLRFQYALKHNGFLFLGSSESLGMVHKDFAVISAKHKIYRLLRPVNLPMDFKNGPKRDVSRLRVSTLPHESRWTPEGGLVDSGLAELLRGYAPPALLINEDRELIHVYGDAQRYMRIPEGAASLEISKLLVGKLAPVGIALLHKVTKDNVPLRSELQIFNPATHAHEMVRVMVRPVADKTTPTRHFLMVFEAQTNASSPVTADAIDVSAVANERIHSLERDLSVTRDSLQATIEELETSNEELQATNEELMASNEELQSTNEELQSVNEELYTVNAENQEKIDILNRLNADLENMTQAALIPTLFVDQELKLTRFTPEASKVFRIREGDVGRPLDDFSHQMDYPGFINDLHRVMSNASLMEREVKTHDGHWYLLRALPYIDRPHNIRGLVITLFDMTYLKDMQHLQSIVDSLPEHVAVLDNTGRITLVNEAWRYFVEHNGGRGLARSGPGENYLEVCQGGEGLDVDVAHQVQSGIRNILKGQQDSFSIKYSCHSADQQRWFLMYAAQVRHVNKGVVISHINITDWDQGEADDTPRA
ncbi:MAG: CheR family methyltransferase [Methylococcales bacterium]|nr:CheR family methyltransferase [Methylococcales bacterium]